MTATRINVDRCLSEARAGSREALGQALQAQCRYLLEIAREEIDQALQAKGGASDLVQETFLEASRDFPRFKGHSAPELRAWLRCLLLRHVAKHGRRFRKTYKRWVGCEVALEAFPGGRENVPAVNLETPSMDAVDGEERRLLQRALERLPSDYRHVILMRYQEGRTFEEIGPLMGRSANAVRLLWLRAVERVKHELKPETNG
ncbi:MAG TPA: sigma-70 family RNA polymerase sigma factor [Gemmataceae bacterium]